MKDRLKLKEPGGNDYKDGEIEVDDNAEASFSEGKEAPGAYVQAWVWVDRDQAEQWPKEGREPKAPDAAVQ